MINGWNWIAAQSDLNGLGNEVRRRARLARKYRNQQTTVDRLQDGRLDELEERADRLEALVVYLVTRLGRSGALADGEAAEILAGLVDQLGPAELIELEDGTVVPAGGERQS